MTIAEPTTIQAGDTVTWTRSNLTQYPAPGWTLVYYLRSTDQAIDITATADGTAHKVSELAAETAKWNPAVYQWQAKVSKAAETYTVDRGKITVVADLAVSGADDYRSHAARVLAAIEAVIEKRATKDQSSYTIGSRSLSRTPMADLILLRDQYRKEVADEEKAARLAKGLGSGSKVLVRFR